MAKIKRRSNPRNSVFRVPQSSITPKNQRVTSRAKKRDDYYNHFFSSEFKESWISDSKPLCPGCNLPADTIKTRTDPFAFEIYGRTDPMETCLDCWRGRRLEI